MHSPDQPPDIASQTSQLAASVFEELHIVPVASNPFHQTIERVVRAAQLIDLPHHQKLIFVQPNNEIIVHFPVLMDDGHHQIFKGYRVQHNNALGPYKGGFRFHPRICLDGAKSLAVLMTLKSALVRVPFGGSSGAVKCNPHELSNEELMRITRRFCSSISNHIGPDYDIPAPDLGTDKQIMAWFVDTYQRLTPDHDQQNSRGVITGKPIELGGSLGREKACGQGLVYVLDEMLPDFGIDIENMNFSMLGFGNVGIWTAQLLEDMGAKMVAVSDETGSLHNHAGINVKALIRYSEKNRGIAGFPDAEEISTDDFYRREVDLFISAAVEHLIDGEKAALINAPIIAEGGNAQVTSEGEAVLTQRGIETLPDILCSAGGVTVSYFEWVQNRSLHYWSIQEVDTQLRNHMVLAARRVKVARVRYECDLRTAAVCAALDHIGKVYDWRGIFP